MNQDIEHFGISLRRARQDRALSVGEISSSTKVPRTALELIEAGNLEGLPADVFVRGFIRSYARAVGVSELQPLAQYDRALRARSEAARAESSLPVVDPTIAGIAMRSDRGGDVFDDSEEAASSRRGLGLAVFVIVLLLIATITLSLLLRRPPPSGEGLSQLQPPSPGQLAEPSDPARGRATEPRRAPKLAQRPARNASDRSTEPGQAPKLLHRPPQSASAARLRRA